MVRKKDSYELICNRCGEKLSVKDIAKHKCKTYKVVLYEKSITFPTLLLFGLGICFINDLNLSWWIIILASVLMGFTIGLFQRLTRYLIGK